jgi:hypothetical protein
MNIRIYDYIKLQYSIRELQEGRRRVKEGMSVLSCPRARRLKRDAQEDAGLLCGKAALFRKAINGAFCIRILELSGSETERKFCLLEY